MVIDVLVLLASLVVLGVAANYLVGSSVRIAKQFGLSEVFIGLTLVAWGTSAPELAVSVIAAINGQGDLSVGNVIGSNIFNLGLILGLVALCYTQPVEKKMLYRDSVVLLAATVLILFFMWDYKINFLEGSVLLLLLASYTLYLFVKKDIDNFEETEEMVIRGKYDKARDFFIFFASLAILVKSSDYSVDAATNIAKTFGISDWAIGATIVAAGTSLPEMATSITAAFKKKFSLAIGNVIGSDIFNALGIIGVSSVIAPISLKGENAIFGFPDFIFSQILLVLTILLIMVFMRTKWTLSRVEGGILFVIAITRMVFEIHLGT